MYFLRFLFPTVSVILFTSCNQDGSLNDKPASDTTIYGSWELHHTNGGMLPPKDYNPGNGNMLHIDSATYQMIRDGQTVESGTYRLVRDSFMDVNSCDMLPPKYAAPNWIVADSSDGLKSYFEISGDTLKLTSGCIPADGGVSLYKRTSGKQ